MRPRRIDRPEPGFYRLRLARGAPWVGARIFRPCPIEMEMEGWQHLDRWPPLRAEIDGAEADPAFVWEYGEAIGQREFAYLIADRAWARTWAPGLPEATPRRPARLADMEPVF